MNMNEDNPLHAAVARREPRPEKPRDPSREEAAGKLDRLADGARSQLQGLDPELEAAVDRLRKLRDDVLQAAGTLDAAGERVRRGELDAEMVPRLRSAFRDEARRELQVAQRKVNEEVEAARERAIQTVLPPLPRGEKTAEAKADVERAFTGTDGEPSSRFVATWRRFLREGDQDALRLLASPWGQDLYTSNGGQATTFAQLRTGLVEEAFGSALFASNPWAQRARKLRTRLVTEATAGTATQVLQAIGKLDEAGGR